MRQRNYEKKEGVMTVFIILLIVEVIGIFSLWKIKEYDYQELIGTYTKENVITVIVTKKERKWLYEKHKLYLNDQKKSYEILEDRGILLKENKKNYYEIVLKIKTPKQKSIKDHLKITIQKEKKRLWDIIIEIWEGD